MKQLTLDHQIAHQYILGDAACKLAVERYATRAKKSLDTLKLLNEKYVHLGLEEKTFVVKEGKEGEEVLIDGMEDWCLKGTKLMDVVGYVDCGTLCPFPFGTSGRG